MHQQETGIPPCVEFEQQAGAKKSSTKDVPVQGIWWMSAIALRGICCGKCWIQNHAIESSLKSRAALREKFLRNMSQRCPPILFYATSCASRDSVRLSQVENEEQSSSTDYCATCQNWRDSIGGNEKRPPMSDIYRRKTRTPRRSRATMRARLCLLGRAGRNHHREG